MNKKIDIKTLMILVTRFRNALDHITPEIESGSFAGFPIGCCGESTDLLQYYLRNNGISTDWMHGDFDNNVTQSLHAWLRYENLYIDITADQFDSNIFPSVIITEIDNYPLNIYLKNIREGVGVTPIALMILDSINKKILKYIEDNHKA